MANKQEKDIMNEKEAAIAIVSAYETIYGKEFDKLEMSVSADPVRINYRKCVLQVEEFLELDIIGKCLARHPENSLYALLSMHGEHLVGTMGEHETIVMFLTRVQEWINDQERFRKNLESARGIGE